MIVYIYGGVSSGKSEYAESLISEKFDKKIYLATMENIGDYAGKRVQKQARAFLLLKNRDILKI